MSADTERSEFAETDTDTDISAEMSAKTNTETDNFLSLITTSWTIINFFRKKKYHTMDNSYKIKKESRIKSHKHHNQKPIFRH